MKRILLLCVLAVPLIALGQAAPQTRAQAAKSAGRPAPESTATPPKPEPLWLSPQQAAARYQEAVNAEREGYHRRAFVAYLEAAENGHGFAQRKMGDLYSSTGPVVKRDYQIALRWYEKARAQGVPIPKPAAFTKGY